jgi:hypothetical protein
MKYETIKYINLFDIHLIQCEVFLFFPTRTVMAFEEFSIYCYHELYDAASPKKVVNAAEFSFYKREVKHLVNQTVKMSRLLMIISIRNQISGSRTVSRCLHKRNGGDFTSKHPKHIDTFDVQEK